MVSIEALKRLLLPYKKLYHDISGEVINPGDTLEIVKSSKNKTRLAVTVKVTYNASATLGVRVRWLYSQNGTDFDSIEEAENAGNYVDLTFAAGGTRQRTITIDFLTEYVKIQIVNKDGSYPVDSVDVWTTTIK